MPVRFSDYRFYDRCTGTLIDLVVKILKMPIESALRFSDCTKICVIVEGGSRALSALLPVTEG